MESSAVISAPEISMTFDLLVSRGRVRWMLKRFSDAERDIRGGNASTPEELISLATFAAGRGFDMYVGLNPDTSTRVKHCADDVYEHRFMFIDLDPDPDYDGQPSLDPSLFAGWVGIDSGRGLQFWGRFDEPVSFPPYDRMAARSAAGRYLGDMRHRFGGTGYRLDTTGADLPRVARLPGSINHKTGRRASFLWTPSRSPVAGLHAAVYPRGHEGGYEVLADSIGNGAVWPVARGHGDERLNLYGVLHHLKDTHRDFILRGVEFPGRHSAAYATVKKLSELGVPQDVAIPWVVGGARKCRPRLSDAEVMGIVKQVYGRKNGNP